MDLLEKHFEQALTTLAGPLANLRILAAVSGGADSVVLAHLCKNLGVHFGIAHCNFALRGAESLRDEQFVLGLASHLGVPFYRKQFETGAYAAQQGTGIQEAARNLRYNWFGELLEAEGYHFVATGHHANDNVETVLMHLFRGSGIKGLRGMLPRQGQILRPLLKVSRADIERYAAENQLDWVEDSSNAGDHYTRNLVRHAVVETMTTVFPRAIDNFNQSVGHLRQAELIYTAGIEERLKKLVVKKGDEQHLPVLKLKKMPASETLLFEWLQDFGFLSGQMPQAWQLLDADSGAMLLSPTHRLIKHRAWLILAEMQPAQAQHIVVEQGDTVVNFADQRLNIQRVDGAATINANAEMAFFDANTIQFPLLLRPWQAGDYFYPLGMHKKKKVARFLIDQKLSKTKKEQVWVLESNQRIVWVVGLRIDDRCKIKPTTSASLVMEIVPV